MTESNVTPLRPTRALSVADVRKIDSGRTVKTEFICLSCFEVYEADDSEPWFHTNQCVDCWDDKDGECYSRNRR